VIQVPPVREDEQLSLLEPPCDDDDPVPETIQVKTKGVRVERTRDFGDVYLALSLWRMLGLDGDTDVPLAHPRPADEDEPE